MPTCRRMDNLEITEKVAALKDQIDEIDKPYHDKLQCRIEEIRKKYPPDVVRAVEKPESERTPGAEVDRNPGARVGAAVARPRPLP